MAPMPPPVYRMHVRGKPGQGLGLAPASQWVSTQHMTEGNSSSPRSPGLPFVTFVLESPTVSPDSQCSSMPRAPTPTPSRGRLPGSP